MAKAKKKVEAVEENVGTARTTDLSVEKRMEMANDMMQEFGMKVNANLGLALDIKMEYTAKGSFPRLVWVDLIAQQRQLEKQRKALPPTEQKDDNEEEKQD